MANSQGRPSPGGLSARAGSGSHDHDLRSTPHCRCGTPMHPDHVEKHQGEKLERYSCPRRRWWNAPLHPHAWMEARDRTH